MTPAIWTTLLILNKFLVYLGIASAIGGSVSMLLFTHHNVLPDRNSVIRQWQQSIGRYALLLTSIGFVANAGDFFVQTGNMSETGVAGMLEPIMLEMLWVSSIGTLTLVRAIFLALSVVLMLFIVRSSTPLYGKRDLVIYAVSTAIIAAGISYSFTLSGHTSELGFGSVILITVHVAVAFAWLGSLVPLLYATSLFSEKELYSLMTRFGHYASWLVALLLIAGSGMLIQLIPSIDELFNTVYGQLFIAKVILVLCMLGFAVWHKFNLVPKLLQQENGHITLRRSIFAESAIGLLVLIATSVVTTAVGPGF
jgi:putative copper resistance protein D